MTNWLKRLFTSSPQVSRNLGENEFEDWTLRSLEDLLEIYNVDARAAAEAALEQPDSDSSVLDVFHQSLQRRFDQMVSSRRDEVSRQLDALNVDLTRLEIPNDATVRIHDSCKSEINAYLSIAKPKIAGAQAQVNGQKTALSIFKQENRISRPAKVTIPPALYYIILIGVVLVESSINGAFFGNLVRGGIAQGGLLALGISVINVAAGVLSGDPYEILTRFS